ncbi:MAG: hypothetical protein QM811_15970 [Pirellulales bacterium]
MKRLLAAGSGPIFQICKAFRNGERGALHNPEFTMVEWYVPGHDAGAGMRLLGELAAATLERGPAETATYADVFRQTFDVCPHTADVEILRNVVRKHGLVAPESLGDDRDGWLDFLLTERIQPTLGRARPLILCDYPASQAALAQVRAGEPPVAERFELYVDGVELANGYHELLDADILNARSKRNNAQRAGRRQAAATRSRSSERGDAFRTAGMCGLRVGLRSSVNGQARRTTDRRCAGFPTGTGVSSITF